MTKRYVALILALILSLTLLPAAMAETAEPEKISYWADMNANMAQTISNLDENLTWQKMQEIFNVDITFKHPAVGAASEAFNMMIAGRVFPDVIEYAWTSYNGGPEKAISDKIIIDLTPYFTPEIMPNLYAYLQENPNIRRQVLTDNGVLYCFPCINISPYKSTSGYIANTDMMAAAGVEEILTIADVDKLARYAQSQGVETPINISSGNILKDTAAGAFGVGYSWYIDDGEVKFGPFEENYKAYIKQYAQWYQDELLNPDFVALTNGQVISSLVEGNTAFTYGYMASCMNTARTTAKSQGKTLNLLGVQYPHSELVEKPIFTGRSWDFSTTSAAITVACKNPELVCRMMDYFYGEEGNLLKNFGVEGYTYNMVDGKPVYSDVIMNDPDHSWRVKMAGMLRCDIAFPGFIVEQFHDISFGFADDAEGISAQTAATWQLYNDYCANYKLPQLTPTEDESAALADITASLNTFMKESIVAMMMGLEDVDTFYDTFVEECKNMGAEEALEIYNAAYQRYLSR